MFYFEHVDATIVGISFSPSYSFFLPLYRYELGRLFSKFQGNCKVRAFFIFWLMVWIYLFILMELAKRVIHIGNE